MDAYQKQFDVRQRNSAYWHGKSHDLLISALTLWKAMQGNNILEANCWGAYKMLMGMSFELLFKAHCVGAGISFRATHDLCELAQTADFTVSKQEAGIFRVLSGHIIWDGRYPIPKTPNQLENHWKLESDVLSDPACIGDFSTVPLTGKLDYEDLLPIWKRFSDLYLETYN